MQKSGMVLKMWVVVKRVFLITLVFFALCLSGCKDTSNQLVNASTSVKYFKVEELVGEINLNSSELKEQVVSVEGIIENINYLNKRETVIIRGKENMNISVICDMQKGQTKLLKSLKMGESITIKGILKGSLKDVILLNCIISKKQSND